MRQIINESDVTKHITGNWVVQMDTRKGEDFSLVGCTNPGFWMEKRISFIGRLYGVDGMPSFTSEEVTTRGGEQKNLIILNGIYYTHGIYSIPQFVEKFNNDPTYIREGKTESERFLRLLTHSELDWLSVQLKEKLNR